MKCFLSRTSVSSIGVSMCVEIQSLILTYVLYNLPMKYLYIQNMYVCSHTHQISVCVCVRVRTRACMRACVCPVNFYCMKYGIKTLVLWAASQTLTPRFYITVVYYCKVQRAALFMRCDAWLMKFNKSWLNTDL